MIPHQSLLDRKNEPIPFLAWVDADAPPPAQFPPFPDTAAQLRDTFFHVAAAYGLRLEAETAAAFAEWAEERPGAMCLRPPVLYLACEGRPELLLAFDWAAWLNHSGYLLKG